MSIIRRSNEGIRFEANGFTLEGGNWNYTDGSTPQNTMQLSQDPQASERVSNTDMFKVQYLTAGEPIHLFLRASL